MKIRIILRFIILVLLNFCHNIVQAGVIRDSEIEETIKLIAEPLAKIGNIKDLKIYLLDDQSLNAFTSGGNEMYINSGIITHFKDIDVLRGVIAHEMGHILGRHVPRQISNIESYQKMFIYSLAVGLATAIVTGKTDLAAMIGLSSQHLAERSILSYSRSFESSADQVAFKLLEKSGNTSAGMIKFFEYLNKEHKGLFTNPYDQTHPLTIERLTTSRNFYSHSKFKNSTNSQNLNYKFARTVAKLESFLLNPKQLLQTAKYDSDEISDYAKAILYFRAGSLSHALPHIDKLIATRPNDPFYHELKGQILFEFGKKEALDCYNKAVDLRPNDPLIKFGRDIVGITIYSDNVEKMRPFYNDLKLITNQEPDNLIALYYLAIFYEKAGQKYDALLNSAIIALKTGEPKRASLLAKAALQGLKKESPQWYKANDIILTTK